MTTRRLSTCGLAAAGVLALSSLVLGQGFNAKAGLWETTAQNTVGGMPDMAGMPKGDTSKMTPEQAAAAAGAMNRGRGGARPVTTRKCWTAEQIAKEQFQDKEMDASCKQTHGVEIGDSRWR